MPKKLILIFSIILYGLSAYHSDGFHHADEHYQIIEFADAKMGKVSVSELPWEYQAKLRSTIQPSLAFLVFNIAEFLGIKNPFVQVALLRFLTVILAFIAILYFAKILRENNLLRFNKLYLSLSLLLFFLFYLNVRYSSETWSGLLMLFPIAILFKKELSKWDPIKIGVLLGFSFLFRYQIAFMILGLLLWMLIIKKFKIKVLSSIILSFMCVVTFGILIDTWYYDTFTVSAWNYFKVNLLEGKASTFGTEPWTYYFTETLKVFGTPIGLLFIIILLTFFSVFRKSLITWVSLPFILVHFLIAHKEYRFLFPLANLIPLMMYMLYEKLMTWEKRPSTPILTKGIQAIVGVVVVVNLLFAVTLSLESAEIGRIEMIRFFNKQNSDTSLHLVHTPWANPIKPWGSSIRHYGLSNVTDYEINSPHLLHDSLFVEGKLNLFILREVDLQKDPLAKTVLMRHKAKIIKQSCNELTKYMGRFFGVFQLQDNLILYQWSKEE